MLLDAGGKARREGVPKSYQVNVPVKGGVNLGSSADIPPLPRRDAERMVH